MHIGKYIHEQVRARRIKVKDIASMVNKSDAGVRKDYKKESLPQAVLEDYARALDINLYRILADEWNRKNRAEPAKETPEKTVTVTLQLDGSLKDEILDLILKKSGKKHKPEQKNGPEQKIK